MTRNAHGENLLTKSSFLLEINDAIGMYQDWQAQQLAWEGAYLVSRDWSLLLKLALNQRDYFYADPLKGGEESSTLKKGSLGAGYRIATGWHAIIETKKQAQDSTIPAKAYTSNRSSFSMLAVF